ncbi:MAG: GNAT family N-acetyltransferase [Planctomycetota bacterium]|nr:GNAT family N-acetyltransferase [Planctomycetota bacterium]
MRSLRDIALIEEQRQAAGLAAVAPESRALAGGTVARGAPGTWYNSAVGLGLGARVSDAEIDELIAFHESHGVEPRIEVCPFADETLARGLASRGFVVRQFEMCFFRELDPASPARPLVETPAGLEIRAVDVRRDDEVRAHTMVAVSGFMPPGQPIAEEFLESCARALRHERTIGVGAWLDGRLVGAGAMEATPPSAGLFGLSVLAEYRRRGIQQALLAWRLNEAARRGCLIACIGSLPGAGTERNVRRMGFQLAYTKVALVRPGEGLTPVAG